MAFLDSISCLYFAMAVNTSVMPAGHLDERRVNVLNIEAKGFLYSGLSMSKFLKSDVSELTGPL